MIEPGTLTITLNGLNSNNQAMSPISTNLTWYSRIWFGNSTNSSIVAATIESFSGILTNTRNIQVTLSGSGYKYIFIPDNINQTGIKFIDPSSGFEVAMNAPINISITNTQSVVLAGKLYRTKNFLGDSITVDIK